MSKPPKKTAMVKQTAALTAQENDRLDQISQDLGAVGIEADRDQLLRAAVGVLARLEPADLAYQWQALAPAKKAQK